VGKTWITCDLNYVAPEGQPPRKYTPLFFHDEAVSFAAGHRPCGKCRHPRFKAYCDAWSKRDGGKASSATEIDEQLHGERFVPGTSRCAHELPWGELPDGAFVHDNGPCLVLGRQLVAWTRDGYSQRRARPVRGTADVITPPSMIAVLSAGYEVQIDAAGYD
jgi:hypothetical protein